MMCILRNWSKKKEEALIRLYEVVLSTQRVRLCLIKVDPCPQKNNYSIVTKTFEEPYPGSGRVRWVMRPRAVNRE